MLDAAMENVRWIADRSRLDVSIGPMVAGSQSIRSVGIIGAGLMGTSIAAAHALHRLPVVIHDTKPESLEAAGASIVADLCVADDGLRLAGAAQRLSDRWVRPTTSLADVARCDLVLEAIVEQVPAKLQLYAELQRHLGQHTIVASNTSTIPIDRLARGVADPSRFCGIHFCHPVPERPLVEIVFGPQTSDRTIAVAVAHARRIERMPIVVRDGPGFVVNRLLFPYLGEALQLLREGVSIESIEQAATEFGMAIGPLRLIDAIGLDTTLQAAWVLAAAFPERIVSSPILVSMIKAGRLGQKSGAGFLAYGGAAQGVADPIADEIIAPWIDSATHLAPEALSHRLVLPMLLEATRILAEEKVGDVREIDLAVLFGLGFPAKKGGLLWWADTVGAERIIAMLQALATTGTHLAPTPMLFALANSGGRFYRHPAALCH